MQSTFEKRGELDREQLEKEVEQEEDLKRKSELEERLAQLAAKSRRRKYGNIT